ncbi:MAG TPA: FlgD immunoglobulin-like domain containing protein [Chthoniobacterales bacterium]|jgi:hypothetical protein
MRAIRLTIFSLLLALTGALGQETPALSPSPSVAATLSPAPAATPVRNVVLRFALPPLDGTISLGIYDQNGNLVRVLHREDTTSDFSAGHDALETNWDGTADDGHSLPNGKYRARGYVVGDLKVEGVDYFFNDWVTDEHSPHILRLDQLWMENGELLAETEMPGGKKTTFICDQTTGVIHGEATAPRGMHCHHIPSFPDVVDCAEGKDGTIWFVDFADPRGPREVRQLSPSNEVLRRLEYAENEPQPERIEVSPTEEKIFLVERNSLLERFRGLSLVRTLPDAGEGAVSDWKSLFEKKIVAHRSFALEDGKPVALPAKSGKDSGAFTQKLRPNPLEHETPGKVELAIGFDEDGSFLKTTDGLPLRTISDTPYLLRALTNRPNDNAIDVFQDDGAVVEQFRISDLAEMIAFDCGEFELK